MFTCFGFFKREIRNTRTLFYLSDSYFYESVTCARCWLAPNRLYVHCAERQVSKASAYRLSLTHKIVHQQKIPS